MSKDNIHIKYEQAELTPEELDLRINRALSLLMSPEDLYQKLNNKIKKYEKRNGAEES